MKWLSILLLIANVAYLGWELDRQTMINNALTQHNLPKIPSGVSQLSFLDYSKVLGDELLTINSMEETPQLAEVNYSSSRTLDSNLELELRLGQLESIKKVANDKLNQNVPLCMSYGPIEGDAKTDELHSYLTSNQVVASKRQAIEESKLYWVYLTSNMNEEKAAAVLDDLKQKGVTDYQHIKSGKFKNAISLGLFSSKERVDDRLEEINAKGYEPVVVPYHKPDLERIYWLDAQFDTTPVDFENINSGISSEFDSKTISCSEIALSTKNP